MSEQQKVRVTTRLWSEEVEIARAAHGEKEPPKEPGYEFSKGQKFESGKGPYQQ